MNTATGAHPRGGLADFLYRNSGILTLALLLPPLLWIGIVYLGSLFALLLQSFYSLDEFSGLIVHESTFSTYRQLFTPTNLTIILRTVVMAAAVIVTAPLREGWLSIAVGAVFIVGGGAAALRAKWHMRQPNGEG